MRISYRLLILGMCIQSLNPSVSRADSPSIASSIVDCASEGKSRSQRSDLRTSINFVNSRESVVRIFWLDYQGNRKHYRDLRPKESYLQQTYVSHPWVVTDEDRSAKCLLLTLPSEQPAELVIR